MNRVGWIVLACAMAATACSGESLTVGENDASAGPVGDSGGADVASTDTGAADTGAVDSGAVDGGAVDTGAVDGATTDATTDASATTDATTDASATDGDSADAGPADAGPADAGSTDAPPADAGAADVPADVRVPPTVGSLVVRLAGNPSNARVTVAGPGSFSRVLDATTTIGDLAFGSYTVAAARTVLGGLSYVPTVEGSPATVNADSPAVVTVTYASTNTPPTLSAVAEQTLYASALTPTVIPFTVNDAEDGAAGLTPTVTSSAPGMATARVVRDGSGWTLSLLPGSVAGSATVTLSVTDSQGAVSTFAINVVVSTAGVVTTNANSGAGSLRAVVAAVPVGATVTFAPTVTGAITLTSSIAVPRSIIIQGPGAGTLAIDGGGRVQLLYVTAPLTVSGLTFSGGYSGSYGGAIQVPGASAPLTISDCAFTNNLADMIGGAIYVSSNLTIARSTFTSNRSANGGALVPTGASNTITGCTFRSNAATQFYGGAVYAYGAARTAIDGCAFLSNSSANFGGAVTLGSVAGTMSITNSTFAGNSAPTNGSAVVLNASSLTMAFCTVTGSTGSAALHILNGAWSIKASIIAGNARGDLSPFGHYESGDYNILASVSGASFSGMLGDVVGEAVALDPVSGYGGPTPTVRLPAGSLAVDAIPAADCASYAGPLAADQRGLPRPAGGRCDVGAFERQPGD